MYPYPIPDKSERNRTSQSPLKPQDPNILLIDGGGPAVSSPSTLPRYKHNRHTKIAECFTTRPGQAIILSSCIRSGLGEDKLVSLFLIACRLPRGKVRLLLITYPHYGDHGNLHHESVRYMPWLEWQ